MDSMKFICVKCGWELFADEPMRCPRCKDTGSWDYEKPRWVKLLERMRGPTDRGVGDTAQRIAARFGGERVKAFATRIGIPCGCADRQDAWNALWPY